MATTTLGLSDKQQALRQQGIGASEVADIVLAGGITTYCRKVGEAEPFEGNSLTEFGHRGERILGEAWMDRHAHEQCRIYTPGTLRHPKYEWALASPDRVVAKPGVGRPSRADWLRLLEMKWVFFSGGEYSEEDVPEKHRLQVAWQLAVCDMQEATLVACVNGDYREYNIQRDLELEEMLLDIVGRFWRENVLARVPPPVDGSKAYTDYLRGRHPKETGPILPLTPEAADIVARLRAAQAESKKAVKAEELVKQQLLQLLGDAAGVEGLCTFKANKDSKKTDWEAVAGELAAPADLVAKHTTTKPGSRLLRLAKEK